MAGVCSKHRYLAPDCLACHATPAQVLGVTEQEWDAEVKAAEARGEFITPCCGFRQYRAPEGEPEECALCGNFITETPDADA